MTLVADMPILTREGSSLRTEQELSLLFVEDVRYIAHTEDPDDYEDAAEIAHEALQSFNRNGDDQLYRYCDEAEDLLNRMGFYVEWNDGYEIFQEA